MDLASKVVGSSRVGVKHQITLSAQAMEVLKLEVGDYILFVRDDGRVLIKKAD